MQLQITKPTELQSEISYEFFTDYADNYTRKIEQGVVLTDKRVRFSASTVRQYKSAIFHFRNFEELLSGRVRTIGISGNLLKSFELFLCQNGLTKNSINTYTSKIKSIGNLLFDQEIAYRPVKFSTRKEITTKVYLSLSELKQINECKTLTDGQRRVADIFILNSFLGMRYGTLQKFLQSPLSYIKEHENNSYIEITSNKTNEVSIIPLANIVIEILTKYNGDLKAPSDRYFNETIKIVGKKSGLLSQISERKTIGGEMTEVLKCKFELLSSHTMRRNFISNAKQSTLTNEQIAGVSGHSDVKSMLLYCRINNLEKVKGILDHEFFKISL